MVSMKYNVILKVVVRLLIASGHNGVIVLTPVELEKELEQKLVPKMEEQNAMVSMNNNVLRFVLDINNI